MSDATTALAEALRKHVWMATSSSGHSLCSCLGTHVATEDWLLDYPAHQAGAVVAAVRGLSPDLQAELIGGEVEDHDYGTAEVTAFIVTEDAAEAEAFVEKVADYAMGLSNDTGCVGRLALTGDPQRRRVVGPWTPEQAEETS